MFDKGILNLIISLLLVVPLLSSMIFTGAETLVADTRGETTGYFTSERIYESTSRVLTGGMAIGDVDSDGQNEVAVCDFQGNLILLERSDGGSFDTLPIWREPGDPGAEKDLYDVVIADLVPGIEGPEIFVGGFSKNVTMIYHDGGEWSSQVVYNSPYRIVTMASGDIDMDGEMEVLFGSLWEKEVSGEWVVDNTIRYTEYDGTGWNTEVIQVPDTVKALEVGDADEDLPGVEVYATTRRTNRETGGTHSELVQAHLSGGNWTTEVIFVEEDNLMANVKVGDIASNHSGSEIVTVSLSGWARIHWQENDTFMHKEIYRAMTQTGDQPSALEGMAVGDVNPLNDGEEAIVSGYYNKVRQIVDVGSGVESDLAWMTSMEDIRLEISGVQIGDIIEEHPGDEAVVASLGGWVQMLSYEYDGLDLIVPEEDVLIEGSQPDEVELTIVPKGLLRGDVLLEFDDLEEVDFTVPDDLVMTDHEPLEVTVTIDPTGKASSDVRRTAVVHATIGDFTTTGEFDILIRPTSVTAGIVLGRASGNAYSGLNLLIRTTVDIEGAEGLDYVDMEVSDDHPGISVSCDSPIVPGTGGNLYVTVSRSAPVGSELISLNASHKGFIIAQAFFSVTVNEIEKNIDPFYLPDPNDKNLFTLHLNFTGPGAIDGVTMELYLGGNLVYNSEHTLSEQEDIKVPFGISKGEGGDVEVVLIKDSREFYRVVVGNVSYREGEEKDDPVVMIFIFVVLVLAAVILVFVFSRYRSSERSSEDESLMEIGGARRYHSSRGLPGSEGSRGPQGERRMPPPRGGPRPYERRIRAPSRDAGGRENIRRAPPRESHERAVRRAPSGSGSRQDVRRAPPREGSGRAERGPPRIRR